jgi:hypothetical protein
MWVWVAFVQKHMFYVAGFRQAPLGLQFSLLSFIDRLFSVCTVHAKKQADFAIWSAKVSQANGLRPSYRPHPRPLVVVL